MNGYEKILFLDEEFFLIGNKIEGGPIATKDQFESGEMSFAHLMPDGRIMRHLSLIGTISDITFTGEFVVLIMSDEGMDRVFDDGFPFMFSADILLGMNFDLTVFDETRELESGDLDE